MNWKCRKCGTLNSDMVDYCTNCRRSHGGCGCSCFTVMAALVTAATLAVVSVALGKDHIKKKMDSGTGARTETEVRSKEE